MKKIGIIDYFIDEWHSNHYIDLFRRANSELGVNYKLSYGWAELDRFEGRLSTEEWCQKNGIEACASIEELCEKSDNILILAPANPEKHLGYAKVALKYGKSTYIDKTFAESADSAKKIYEIAKQYNTKIFSSSALRYADELTDLPENIESLQITGNGRSLNEYCIHQIEIAVKLMGSGAECLRVYHQRHQATVIISFGNKTAVLNYAASKKPFSVDAQAADRNNSVYKLIEGNEYFYNLIKDILVFFETGKQPFDPAQTITAIAIRDAVIKAVGMEQGAEIIVEK